MVLVLAWLGCGAAVGAADLTGSFYVEGDPYPDLGVGGGAVLTLSTEVWSVKNTTTFDAWPEITDSQVLEIGCAVGDLSLLATAAFSFTAVTFEPLDVTLSGDVWTAELPAEDPRVEITCTAGAGATIDAAVESRQFLDTTVAVGDHWVTHSLTLYAHPAGVESYVDAFLSVFRTTIGDGDPTMTISLSAFAETYLIPFEFSYATVKVKASLDRASLTGIVTYLGGTEFTVALRLGMSFGPMAIDE